MSEIKALDKLREMVDKSRYEYEQGNVSYVVGFNDIADEIQAEVDSHHLLLPVDADGVPIRVGDEVEYKHSHSRGIVKAVNENMVIAIHVDNGYTNYAKYGLLWDAENCRRSKPRTVEDVIRDAVVYGISVEDAAEEIRGMMADESR